MLVKKMKAIEISSFGGPQVLREVETSMPQPGEQEILIRVHAAGVNRADVAQRQGNYPPPKGVSLLPGLEVAGEIAALGNNADRFDLGDKVTALLPGGGYAEYAVIHQTNALPLPKDFDFILAAAIPENYFTVWSNVFDLGKLKSGETFLVHGGTSGIGTAAIQLAKAFGARVIATAGSDEKCQACLDLGADHAINYKTSDYASDILSYTDNHGVDVTLDMVGGDYANKNFKIAAHEGRIVQIAYLHGNMATVNLNYIMRKRLHFTGSTLRERDVSFKAKIANELYQHVWPLFNDKSIKPIIDKTFPLHEADKAQQRMESSQHIGKIILEID